VKRLSMTFSLAALLMASVACSGTSSSTATPTSPSSTTTTDVLRGTVPPPVNGVLQSAFDPFDVGQSGGTVTVTLTSAVETLPGNTLLTTVTMGLGIGTITNDTCTLLTGAFATAQAGATPQLTGTLNPGTYCVQVSDVTNELGPVSFAVAVEHP
jgi:hypothetical protein